MYNRNHENRILFKNGQRSDAIVCLVEYASGRTIRNEYIRAATNFEMTNIPNGTYYVKAFYGRDWNPKKQILDGRITGAFDTDFSFSQSDDDPFVLRDDGYQYSVYTVTLYTVEGGNMQSEGINASQFFQ